MRHTTTHFATTPSLRRWLTIALLTVGAVTTIATSAPVDPTVEDERTLDLAPMEVAYLEIVVNEIAMDHVRTHEDVAGEFTFMARFYADERVRFVPEDAGLETIEDEDATFYVGLDGCPSAGECRLGFIIETMGDRGAVVTGNASVRVEADGTFILPENRSFPDGAEIRIALDGE